MKYKFLSVISTVPSVISTVVSVISTERSEWRNLFKRIGPSFKRWSVALALLTLLHASMSGQARWITSDSTGCDEYNTWIEFRKEISLKRVPREVCAEIAADSKYWLWVNGNLAVFEGGLKRGPDPEGTYYDVIDLAPYLEKGTNTIRILLWHFGKDGFSHKDSGKAGLILDAPAIGLVTDSGWESRRLSAYTSVTDPRPNYRLSEASIRYDARKADSDPWKPALETGAWGDEPWGHLMRRPIPLWKDFGVKYADYVRQEQDGNVILSVQLPYNMQFTPVISVTDISEGTLIRMQTNHLKGGSEYGICGEYITRSGTQDYESLGWMNGEVLQLIYPKDSGVTVNAVGYRETGFDCEREGRFVCSDAVVNRFWDKAMRTLYVNMRDTYFDCPDRERAQWWGDVTVLMGQSFYQLSPRANSLTRKAMYELVNWQREDGVIYSPVPAGARTSELPAQMLASIGTYGFWYYYMHTADRQAIMDVYPAVKRYLSLWTLDEDGLTAFRKGGWSWGDWGKNIDIRLILASWHYLALESAANMAFLCGCDGDIPGYRTLQESIVKAYDRCWNGHEYRHPSYTGLTDDRVNAMAVVTGIAAPDRYEALYEHFKSAEHASPYMEKYVLEALVKMGYADYALERFKKRFGPMIDHPVYTTLFEGWDVGGYGGGSTNHAWSGGMLTVISENICGLRPLQPGWKEFEVSPYPVISECDITVPTVSGKIRSSFRADGRSFVLEVIVPRSTRCTVKIPSEYKIVTMNGRASEGIRTVSSGKYIFRCIR